MIEKVLYQLTYLKDPSLRSFKAFRNFNLQTPSSLTRFRFSILHFQIYYIIILSLIYDDQWNNISNASL